MGLEQRHAHALEPEAEAPPGIRDRAVRGLDLERFAEVASWKLNEHTAVGFSFEITGTSTSNLSFCSR